MKKILWIVPVLMLAACGRKVNTNSSSGSPIKDAEVQIEEMGEYDPIASPEAKRGGSHVTWGGAYPKALNMWLDPFATNVQICGLMFEGLVGLNSTKDEPVGGLAESWEVSPDKTTYTFKIHPAAKWSDGKPVTAEDVQFYYDVIMNPKHLTSIFRVGLSRFSRPEVVDEKTVRVVAKEAHWMNFWEAGGMVAFPKHVWEGKDFNQITFDFPVVSGPYELAEAKTNRYIKLKRRGGWWGRVRKYNQNKYNFDYLVYRCLERDDSKILEMLKKGDIDTYPVYRASVWAQQTNFDQVKKNWIVRQEVYNQEPKAFQGFALNMRRPLFQDVRVREALAYLLNRKQISEKIMFNQYFLLNSYYPDLYENNLNPEFPLVEYDPEKARALLKEAGWTVNESGVLMKDGKPLELVYLHQGEMLPHLNIYLEDLKAVGIQARVDMVSNATYTKREDAHDFDMLWKNFGAGRLRDPETLWHSKTAKELATLNVSGVEDAEIDRLIEAQKLEMDLSKRNEILKKIDRRLLEIKPYVLLWQSDRTRLLYWNKFGTPQNVLDKYNREDVITTYWWYNEGKAVALEEAKKNGTPLKPEPAEVHYTE